MESSKCLPRQERDTTDVSQAPYTLITIKPDAKVCKPKDRRQQWHRGWEYEENSTSLKELKVSNIYSMVDMRSDSGVSL